MHAGVDGLLRDKTRPSRKPPLGRALIARVVELTASDPCGEATHWTAAVMAKLKDIVGLYVDPPAHAVVLSVDEKSQIRALDRIRPGLPMKRGRAGTMTHDYKRDGTTTLFATLDGWREGSPAAACNATATRSSFASSMPSRPSAGRQDGS